MLPLPRIMAEAMAKTTYSGQYEERYASVTELLKPAWMSRLAYIHQGEYSPKPSVWAFFGTAFHEAMESRLKDHNQVISEERLSMDVSGYRITGGVDLYYQDPDTGEYVVTDLKTTTSYALKKPDRLAEWTAQLNCYAMMYRRAGFQVDKLSVLVLIRDMKTFDQDDPSQQPVQELAIEDWGDQKTRDWIVSRIIEREKLQLSANKPELEEIAQYNHYGCSQEDRWEKPASYPVHKQTGGSSAAKASVVCSSVADAQAYAEDHPKNSYTIGHRPAVRIRCESYCDLSPFCAGYQAWKAVTS